jgi:hypothetical protein
LEEVGAGVDRLPVEVAGDLRAVVHHAAEEAVAGGNGAVLLQEVDRPRRELEVLRVAAALGRQPLDGVRCGRQHAADPFDVDRSSDLTHPLGERPHHRRRSLDHHAAGLRRHHQFAALTTDHHR